MVQIYLNCKTHQIHGICKQLWTVLDLNHIFKKKTNTSSKSNLFDISIDSESYEVSVNDNLLDSENNVQLRTPTLIPHNIITPNNSGDRRDDGKIQIVCHDVFCMIK